MHKIDNLAHGIALYNAVSLPSPHAWSDWLSAMEQGGLKWTKFSVSPKGGPRIRKVADFKKLMSLPDNLQCFDPCSEHGSLTSDLNGYAHIDYIANHLLFVVPAHTKSLPQLMEDVSGLVEEAYGIAYARAQRLGPVFYAWGTTVGLGYGNGNEAEREQIASWGRERRRSEGTRDNAGLLRDVYPVNLLRESQLKSSVGSLSLSEWIQANKNHGELKQTGAKKWIWTLDNNEIENARKHLKSNNILIACL